MIKIKINKSSVNIPRFNELTVAEYRELLPHISKTGMINVVKYISVTTGIDYKSTLKMEVDGLGLLNSSLGDFKFIAGADEFVNGINYIESLKPSLIQKYKGKIYDFRRKKPKEVGYRILLEQYLLEEPSYLDLYLFMSAAMLCESFDYDEVIEVKTNLENKNAFDILAFGAFFFKKWKRKESKESLLSKVLRKVILMTMPQRKTKLVLIDLKSIRRLKKLS